MLLVLKAIFAVATGMVGGYVHRGLGVQWGILLMLGYVFGFWVWKFLR